MGQITIYPDKELEEVLNDESKKQKRSVNNLIIYSLEQIFKKQLNRLKKNERTI